MASSAPVGNASHWRNPRKLDSNARNDPGSMVSPPCGSPPPQASAPSTAQQAATRASQARFIMCSRLRSENGIAQHLSGVVHLLHDRTLFLRIDGFLHRRVELPE